MGETLKNLFSSSVAVMETRTPTADTSFLSPEERTYLENVSQIDSSFFEGVDTFVHTAALVHRKEKNTT